MVTITLAVTLPKRMTDPGIIYAAKYWPTNAHMVADCVRLGYLRSNMKILDPTYGLGNFWTIWHPPLLGWHDIALDGVDFRSLPEADESYDAVVFDPPYKMNGTPTDWVDGRYGVGVSTRWQDRLKLIMHGVEECIRVVKKGGYLLVKCQDQVVSGKVVWQTDMVTNIAMAEGMTKVDRLDFMTNPRPQPHRRQLHARRNYSTLLIFKKD